MHLNLKKNIGLSDDLYRAASLKMSGWSFGFNQSLHHSSETSLTEVQPPLYSSTLHSEKIDKVQKEGKKRHQDVDTSPNMMKDHLLKVNGDQNESRGSAFCTKDNLLNCIAYVNQVIIELNIS